jgi:hypothetical protein
MAENYGSIGTFQMASLSSESLGRAITSLSSSLTATRVELTELGGNTQRDVRDVLREDRRTQLEHCVSEDWWAYEQEDWTHEHQKTQGTLLKRWKYNNGNWDPTPLHSSRSVGVALRRTVCGEGAERMVHKFCEYDREEIFVGTRLIAKESRFVSEYGSGDHMAYHEGFVRTQDRAQKLALSFNRRLAKNFKRMNPRSSRSTPLIEFLSCSVYEVRDKDWGKTGVLVEKMLDQTKYKKWNGNNGMVDGQDFEADRVRLLGRLDVAGGLGIIEESDEDYDEDEEPDEHRSINIEDVPQAFSHFTWVETKRKMLVCDLQGVLDDSSSPPVLELTDPVIHYVSKKGRKNVHGRTDHGQKGVERFFCTHRCNAVCRLLDLPQTGSR